MEGVGEGKQGNLELRRADSASLDLVGEITRRTIRTVYPHYYPQGVVDFFLRWHEDRRILPDVLAGEVYLLFDGGTAVGTVTLHGMEITRLYVPPEYQGERIRPAFAGFCGEGHRRDLGKNPGRGFSACRGAVLEAGLPGDGLPNGAPGKRRCALLEHYGTGMEPRTKPQGSMTFRIWGD